MLKDDRESLIQAGLYADNMLNDIICACTVYGGHRNIRL